MYNQLSIEGDPTRWILASTIDETALATAGPPLVATTLHPLPGTLLVSGRAARWVLFASAGGEPHGPIPTDAVPGPSHLYLPAPAGLDPSAPGYTLAAGTDVAALQAGIVTAMTNGTTLAVPLADGELMLNGALLPFAAIFRAV
jgi:hypothetical protein